jgi:hypothetical protein
MPLPLPKPIELFMSSENTHDLEALADCFAAHATVRDEGQTMQGLKAIKAWRLEAGKTLSGDFPGSPITLDFIFTLEGDKIAALEIDS